jgi:undecaprenyl-phosphate 4-deoxy-4-formamido-L-arabinose transferase
MIRSIIPFARSPIFVWPELIFRAKLKGYKVDNIRVKCNVENVRKGAFGHPHDIMWGIYEMLRFRIRLWNKNY